MASNTFDQNLQANFSLHYDVVLNVPGESTSEAYELPEIVQNKRFIIVQRFASNLMEFNELKLMALKL